MPPRFPFGHPLGTVALNGKSFMTETKPRVLVIGDVMIDHYLHGSATRISPEAPIPVVKVVSQERRSGGAVNVAENLNSLGVDERLAILPLPWPEKHRLMVGDTQVARWDTNDVLPPHDIEALDKCVADWPPDAIVISDYAKGSVTDEVIDWIAERRVLTYVDSKRMPFDFPPECVFFPNQKEYNLWECAYARQLMVVLKRGASGIAELSKGVVIEEYPAMACHVRSVCGAGDVVLAAYVAAQMRGEPNRKALWYANLAAAVAVEQPYTAVVRPEQIEAKMKEVAR